MQKQTGDSSGAVVTSGSPREEVLAIVREYYDAGHIVDLNADVMAHKITDAIERNLTQVASVRSASGSRKLLVWSTNALRDTTPTGTPLYSWMSGVRETRPTNTVGPYLNPDIAPASERTGSRHEHAAVGTPLDGVTAGETA